MRVVGGRPSKGSLSCFQRRDSPDLPPASLLAASHTQSHTRAPAFSHTRRSRGARGAFPTCHPVKTSRSGSEVLGAFRQSGGPRVSDKYDTQKGGGGKDSKKHKHCSTFHCRARRTTPPHPPGGRSRSPHQAWHETTPSGATPPRWGSLHSQGPRRNGGCRTPLPRPGLGSPVSVSLECGVSPKDPSGSHTYAPCFRARGEGGDATL